MRVKTDTLDCVKMRHSCSEKQLVQGHGTDWEKLFAKHTSGKEPVLTVQRTLRTPQPNPTSATGT